MNGDGLLDRVVTGSSSSWQVQLNANPVRPGLLLATKNGLGGISTFRYKPSTSFKNDGGDGVPDLPAVTWVVDGIRQSDGTCDPGAADPFDRSNPCVQGGHDLITEYVYRDGRLAVEYEDLPGGGRKLIEREFRGFRNVTAIDGDFNSAVRTFGQEAVDKGKLLTRETYSEANEPVPHPVSVEENTWSTRDAGAGRTQLWLNLNVKSTYDLSYPSAPHVIETYNLAPDLYGNIGGTFTLNGASQDIVYTQTDYAQPTDGTSVYDKPSHTYTGYYAPDFTTLVEKWFYYDGGTEGLASGQVAEGNVKVVESWLNTGSNVKTHMEYDEYGNVTQLTDERGFTSTTVYDAQHLHPYQETTPSSRPSPR